MKKIIASILTIVMILSVLVTMAIVPATAASTDTGMWGVYANAGAYALDGEGKPDYTTTPDAPVAGYEYTEDGFKVTSEASSRLGTAQRFNIMSKVPQNLKRGITMTVRVDEFKEGDDWWHSFVIWDQPNLTQGDTSGKYGNGYFNLFRGNTVKTKVGGTRENPIYDYVFEGQWTMILSHISDQTYYDKTGTALQPGDATHPMTGNLIDFGNVPGNSIADPDKAPVVNEDGSYTLTMKLEYDDVLDSYRLFFCGVEVTQPAIDAYLKYRFPDGMAYIGFSSHGSLTDCNPTVTITEYNGTVPTGTDKSEFQSNSEEIAEIIPGSEIPDDQPVLFYDALNADGVYKNTGSLHSSGLTYDVKADGSFWIKPTSATSMYIVNPRNAYSYEASEFPYIAVLLRNFCTCTLDEETTDCYGSETLGIYYCAGETLNPTDERNIGGLWVASQFEDDYGNYYTLFIFDMTPDGEHEIKEGWSGRINKIEVVFQNVNTTNPAQNNFDMVYTAFFKTADAAQNYAENYAEEYEMCPHEDIEVLPAKEPTCNSMGKTEGQICTVCNAILVLQEDLAALEHEWVDAEEIPATCDQNGRRAGQSCTLCGTSKGAVIEMLGHLYEYEETADGHYQVCSRTGCEYQGELEAHTLVEEVCSVCGYGCAHDDTTTRITKEPTCLVAGVQETKCNKCGKTTSSEIAALGHTALDDETTVKVGAVAPTCEEAGQTEGYKCGRTGCGEWIVKAEPIAATGHTLETIPAVEATCTAGGKTEGQKCTVCNAETVAPVDTDPAPHTYDDEKDADCNVCGVEREIATEAPTSAPTGGNKTENKNDTSAKEEKKGCGSVVGFSAFAIIASVAVAGVVSFKKKED